ncbi:hypothetical protein FJZ27_01780, partial [Candidatus Peribacteria bacterium]|nr:hypothetical protein [Candidatus Peribacteria bacterium]
MTATLRGNKHILAFGGLSVEFLDEFAQSPDRASFTGMQNGRGMPTELNIQDLRRWCTTAEGVDMELLRAITGMQHARGMPTELNIQDLRRWCTTDEGND